MSIRLPLYTVVSFDDSGDVGAGSVAGVATKTFTLPQDTDNVVVKFTASIVGGGASATFQTTDDGGATWYDVARTSVVSNANNTTAEWLSIPVVSSGVNPIVKSTANAGSILGGSIGSSASSTLGSRQVSGLPVLGVFNRIAIIYSAGVSANTVCLTQVKANSEAIGT